MRYPNQSGIGRLYGAREFIMPLILGCIAAFSLLALIQGNEGGAAPFLLAAVAVFAILFNRYPTTIVCYGSVFFLFQELIAYIVEQRTKSDFLVSMVKWTDEVFILLAFSIIFIRNNYKIRRTPIDLFIAGSVACGLISSLINGVSFFITALGAFMMFKGLLVFYIFSNLDYSEKDLARFVRVTGTVGTIILLCGFLDLIDPVQFRTMIGNTPYVDYRFGIPSIESIFIHPGVFGWFAAAMSLFAYAFYAYFQRRKYAVLSVVFAIGSLLSMRRKSIAGLLIGFIGGIGLIPMNNRVKYRSIFILLCCVLLIVFSPTVVGLYSNLMETYIEARDPMKNARDALYITSGTIALDYFPFGTGFGQYAGWISKEYYSPVYQKYGLINVAGLSEKNANFLNDTYWPHILGELGLFGGLLYVGIFLKLLIMAKKAYIALERPMDKIFALGSFVLLLHAMVESLGQPNFEKAPDIFYVFGCLGIVYSIYSAHLVDQKKLQK